jgi:cation diffusion facilitator CzcD-associated flavoprotein CzcO
VTVEINGHQVVVIGAGPAGIASALALKDKGVRPLVIDAAEEVASSWRARYDRLRLNTSRPLSHLPGRRFSRGTPMFPARDAVIAHIERHAREDGMELELGTRVERIERAATGWRLRTTSGEIRAHSVVVATGYEREPVIPQWDGREAFAGELLHSSDYRRAAPFRDRRVLVVGPGCSGMEIAHDLVEGGADQVWLSARTPPNILLRAGPGGLPGDMLAVALLHLPPAIGDAVARFGRRKALGDLERYGLPVPDEGVFTRLRRTGAAPAIVDREVIDDIRNGRITIVAGVEGLEPHAARLGDGTRIEADAVICATGYRRALEPLVGHLGVLGDRGVPRRRGAVPAAPGLRFIGFVPRPGGIHHMATEARRSARAIARELAQAGATEEHH